MSLCFLEAVKAHQDSRISEQEYVGHLTSHLYGTRHTGDSLANQAIAHQLRTRSIFAAVFREFILSNRAISPEDTVYYVHILRQCSAGNLEATSFLLAELERSQALPVPLQALAVLAAQKGHMKVLELLLQKGAVFDMDVEAACQQAADPVRRGDDSSKSRTNELEEKPVGSCPDCGGPPNSCVRTYTPQKLAEVFSDIDKLW